MQVVCSRLLLCRARKAAHYAHLRDATNVVCLAWGTWRKVKSRDDLLPTSRAVGQDQDEIALLSLWSFRLRMLFEWWMGNGG